jgi:hypothetical protein
LPLQREGTWEEKEVSEVLTSIDSGLDIDSGLLSGLVAKGEIRRLLDELFESLESELR